jgi:hypothetical protein
LHLHLGPESLIRHLPSNVLGVFVFQLQQCIMQSSSRENLFKVRSLRRPVKMVVPMNGTPASVEIDKDIAASAQDLQRTDGSIQTERQHENMATQKPPLPAVVKVGSPYDRAYIHLL